MAEAREWTDQQYLEIARNAIEAIPFPSGLEQRVKATFDLVHRTHTEADYLVTLSRDAGVPLRSETNFGLDSGQLRLLIEELLASPTESDLVRVLSSLLTYCMTAAREMIRLTRTDPTVLSPSTHREAGEVGRRLMKRLEQEQETLRIAASAASSATRMRTGSAAALAEKAAAAAQQAAGEAASKVESLLFDSVARRESTAAKRYRFATFVLAASSFGLSAYFYFAPDVPADLGQVEAWADLTARILAVLALLGIAAYTSRISAGHREVARWAEFLKVQLDTFEAFTEPIEDDATRARIYEMFASRVLGPGPTSAQHDMPQLDPQMVLELLRRQT